MVNASLLDLAPGTENIATFQRDQQLICVGFGGSTSPEAQWPEDETEGDGEDRFEKMEKLLQRTCKCPSPWIP